MSRSKSTFVIAFALGLGVAPASFTATAVAAPGDLGVSMVTDIDPAPGASGVESTFEPMPRLGGVLLFSGNDGSIGAELWRSDGTASGTTLVKDINPGADEDPPVPDASDPEAFTVVGDTLYFTADDGVNGRELWKTDGTTAGTTPVKDINPGADEEPPDPDHSDIDWITGVGSRAFFQADDGTNGAELWTSDGTGPGTQIMNGPAGINPVMGAGSSPSQLAAVGTTLFFNASGPDGSELWKTESPYGSAVQVADINPTGSAAPASFVEYGGTLFFAAADGTTGRELWKSDGGALGSGTELVKDINQTPASSADSNPVSLTVAGDTLFFVANDGQTGFPGELWKSNGSGGGTSLVADINPSPGVGSTPYGLADVGGALYFSATEPLGGNEPWKSDGSPGGTARIADIFPGPTGSDPIFNSRYHVFGGSAFLDAHDGVNGRELWMTNGGPLGAGTRMVADISPGSGGSFPGRFVELNGSLFFTAATSSSGNELWKLSIEGTPPPPASPGAPTAKKKCKKGRKLKKGKCVKKKRKKRKK